MIERPARVGDVIDGFCGGLFGRDWIGERGRIEALGPDWVVMRAESGTVWFGSSPEGPIDEWIREHIR